MNMIYGWTSIPEWDDDGTTEEHSNTFADGVEFKVKPCLAECPCQSCGKMVTIMVPFLGCVFCQECIEGGDGTYIYREQF